MDKIMGFLTMYGLEAVIMALAINILTGLVKLPIKYFAQKMKNSNSITRFLVFLPIIFGFLLTLLYGVLTNGEIKIDNVFYRLWLSSSSLSLTFYAIFEKLFPSKKSILKDYEIEANKQLIDEIKSFVKLQEPTTEMSIEEELKPDTDTVNSLQKIEAEQAAATCGDANCIQTKRHFVLGGFNSEKTEIEEK